MDRTMQNEKTDVRLEYMDDSSDFSYKFKTECQVNTGMKYVLVIGRIIGVIPHSISSGESGENSLNFRRRSISVFHNVFNIFLELAMVIPQLAYVFSQVGSHSNVLGEMQELEFSLFLVAVVSVCLYFNKKGAELINLLHKWEDTTQKLNLTTEDIAFQKFCLKISIPVMALGLAESILRIFHYIHKHENEWEGLSLSEKLWKEEGMYLEKYFVNYYNIPLILAVYTTKIGGLIWTFGDVFIIVLCRALAHLFKQVDLELHTGLFNSGKEPFKNEKSRKIESDVELNLENLKMVKPFENDKFWEETRAKLLSLIELGNSVANFISPLVLICIGFSLYFIILTFLRFAYEGIDGSAYVYVCGSQLVARVGLVIYYTAEVYHSSEGIQNTIENYLLWGTSPVASGLERMLARHPVRVTLLGVVVITRQFFISIVSFLFTTEIVLLQAMSTPSVK